MKKYFYILAALTIAPTFAIAQSLESDVDAELDQMYSGAESAQVTAPVTTPSAGIANSAPVSGQPIYILNQATPTSNANANAQLQQSQVQKQPTTVIEASPLTESRAEQIRRARQDAETATEQRIVEKLEQSRMEDERKRANVLFGDRFDNMNNSNNNSNNVNQVQQVVPAPVPVQQVQPIIVQAPPAEPKENTRDIVREEIAAAMKVEEESAVGPVESKYIAGLLGIGDYPDTRDIKGNYAVGVALGTKYDNFVLEGAFMFSNYTVERQGYYTGGGYNNGYGSPYGYGYPYNTGMFVPDTIDVAQYSGSLAAKVQLFSGIIKPVFGGVVAYSYRSFSWNNITGLNNDTKASSHAVDVGTLVGADIEFSPKYAIGLDFRYMWNLSSRVNGGNTWMSNNYSNPIEKLQYYTMSIAGKVNF